MRFLLLVALQLRIAGSEVAPKVSAAIATDSIRDLLRARGAQASFERSRRSLLPYSASAAGRCDVRLGRFCWWYDEREPVFPPEAAGIGRRRVELLTELDSLSLRHPGDDWLWGMRVHYRVDGRNMAGADSVARACRATAWWCAALMGYASHALGQAAAAESAFGASVAAMPLDVACAWRNIAPLIDDDARRDYERLPCGERLSMERRYWLLSRPQLSEAANEWQNEFNARRVLVWLGERGATPHLSTWGWDAAELVLRYGWPVSWSRIATAGALGAEPAIVGHDPSPSFAFAPRRVLADSASPLTDDDWDLANRGAQTRHAPRLVRRVTKVAAQFARFRRGDSTLVAAAFAVEDDSLRAATATLGAAGADGIVASRRVDFGGRGTLRVIVAGAPVLAGVDVADTTTRTLARVRAGFSPSSGGGRLAVSDLLVYRGGGEPALSLDSALARAIAGDLLQRSVPAGLFWETYGLTPEGESVDLSVRVDRVDRGFLRRTRQRVGLAAADTPIRIQWADARPPTDRAAPHAVSIDLGNLDAGRYRITLTVIPAMGPAIATSREIVLIDP
ncbi:hypothetical protein BH11GEM1_BH11GEM1_19200 [soil metagenome]